MLGLQWNPRLYSDPGCCSLILNPLCHGNKIERHRVIVWQLLDPWKLAQFFFSSATYSSFLGTFQVTNCQFLSNDFLCKDRRPHYIKFTYYRDAQCKIVSMAETALCPLPIFPSECRNNMSVDTRLEQVVERARMLTWVDSSLLMVVRCIQRNDQR